ncbi:hypothetical protein [Paenibacillus selenitireducens]|nr:hypothetical protein [Paenibacillus selenitireducens]
MFAYACIGILFLFVIVKCIQYGWHRKKSLDPETIDKALLGMLNSERDKA